MLSAKKFILKYIILKILSNEYSEGATIPSENRLAIKFNCARLTARSALIMLVHAGILNSRQGQGYCVSNEALNTLMYALKLKRSADYSTVTQLKNFDVNTFKLIDIKNHTDAFLISNYNQKDELLSATFLFINKLGISKTNSKLLDFKKTPLDALISFGIFPNTINTAFISLLFDFKIKDFEHLKYNRSKYIPVIYQEWKNYNDEWFAKTVNILKNEAVLFDTSIKF